MKKILFIDDDKTHHTIVKTIISSNFPNFELLCAFNGKDGLKIAQKENPDTILLDIIMPELDGFEVCRLLKDNESTWNIPVLMLTSRTDSESRVKGLNMGADAFLSKPIIASELVAQLNVMSRIKDAEDKLRAEKENLEGIVLRRTLALTESEEKYHSLFSSANDAVFIMQKGIFIECNPKTLELFGCKENEIIGFSPIGFSPEYQPDGSLSSQKALEKIKAANKGETQFFEWLHQQKDGTPFDAEVSLNKINLSGGEYVHAVVRDITQRKQTERKLRESKGRFKKLSNLTFEGIIIHDRGIVVDVNRSFLEMLGYNHKEIIGKNIIDLAVEKKYHRIIIENIIKRSTKPYEAIGIRKDGSKFPVEIESRNVYDENKDRRVTAIRDITERKRAEQIQKLLFNISNQVNINQSINKLIAYIHIELGELIDTSNFYIALYDEKTNQISLPFFADEKDDYESFPAGKTLTKYVIDTKKTLIGTKEIIKKLVESGDVESIGEDAEIWIGVPLKIEGNVIGVLAVQSYTNEKAYNESDIKMLEFVSGQISLTLHRTKTLEDLKAALEKATESDRLKSVFLATMSHELRTPLNSIIGFSELIDTEMSLDIIFELTNTIHLSGLHLLRIVEDLFEITLIESGEIEIEKEDVELHTIIDIVNDTFNEAKQILNKNHIAINLQIPSEDQKMIIHTDINRLNQILYNLINNALKFTEEGEITFGVNHNSKEKTDFLIFSIKDSGIGIAKEKHELIYETFKQVEDAHNRKYGGTGIGLTIARKLLGKLGGEIWLESELGKGSTFYFKIPAGTNGTSNFLSAKPDIEEEKPDKEIEWSSATKKNTILIVEDDKPSLELLNIILQNSGFTVISAINGKIAVQLCKDNPEIDLVLMDMNMPVMNGFDATIEIKKFRPKLPIIAQTAFAFKEDREKTVAAGCVDFISKPIKKELLLEKINHLKITVTNQYG